MTKLPAGETSVATRAGKGIVATALLAVALTQVACGGADNDGTSRPPAEPATEDSRRPSETSPERTEDMKISLSFDDIELTATLVDSGTTRDFLSLLPRRLTLRDYAETEKISDLPRRLSTADAPDGVDPDVGDITYYAPWGNLAIFYHDFGYSTGLVKLGRIDSGIDALARMSGDVTVTIERVDAAAS
jgi:hypothetical protein